MYIQMEPKWSEVFLKSLKNNDLAGLLDVSSYN